MIRKRPISLELKVVSLGVCYYGVLDVDVGFMNIRSLMSECIPPVQYLSYTELSTSMLSTGLIIYVYIKHWAHFEEYLSFSAPF